MVFRVVFYLAWLLLFQAVAAGAGDGAGRGGWGRSGGAGAAPAGASGAGESLVVADPGSGCSCKEREAPGILVCFDLMTCVRFPRNVTVPGHTLYVRATLIPELVVGDLQRLNHLTELAVENSHRLSRVQPGAFQGMHLLVNLSVSFNPLLTHLEAGALDGLVALRELRLIKNGFHSLAADVTPALGAATLPRLRVLNLSENRVRVVAQGDFQSMAGSPLEDLSLASCGLEALHPAGLVPLRQLAVLRLGDNNLDVAVLAAAVDQLVAAGLPLHGLDLPNIGARGPPLQLLQVVARSAVTELVLKYNEMERLAPGSFPAMPGLRYLDLSHVDLTEGQPGTLAAEVVPALQTINLSGNRLPGLTAGFLPDSLVSLDLSTNSGNLNQGNAYFELGARKFENMSQLQFLHLSYNRVLRLTNESFVGLDNLKVLTMKNSSLFKLDVGVFLPLRQLEHLNLERNLFPAYRPMRADMFLGLGRLRVLLLGECRMRGLGEPDVFRHLVGLTRLDLRDNELTTLDGSRAFRSLRSLAWLDLSRNRIGSWRSERLFAANPRLRELHAAGNTLTFLSGVMIQDLEAIEVADLADNIFNCGCDFFRPVHTWLRTAKQRRNISRLFTVSRLEHSAP